LLALPHDLLERIFLYLDAQDVRRRTFVSRRINNFVPSSVILRYRLACHAAGVVDNPCCNLSFAERYEALIKREKAWWRFQPAFIKTFHDAFKASPICSLTSGVHLYGESGGRNLHYCFLPSTPDDVLRWTTIPSHAPVKNWIVPLHISVRWAWPVVIMISWSSSSPRVWYSLYITLLQFSTGEHHPLAHRPRIDVGEYEMGQHVFLEVAGDNIALLIDTYGISQLSIFDWKTGLKKLQHHTLETAYCRLAFVSPEILLVPNAIKGQYEVWRIPMEADGVPYQMLGLCFPALSKGHSIIRFEDCRGRPNPHNMLRTSPKPFHTSPDETVIITIVNIAVSPNQFGPRFALFIRCRSLLEAITNLTHVKSIPWSEWEPVSRWFSTGNGDQTWSNTSGQRWVFLEPVDDGDERYRLSIIDFNPYNVYNPQDYLPGDLVVRRKGDYFDHGNVFAEEIEMGLGCTIYRAPQAYDHNTWFIDDESVLALKVRASYGFFCLFTYGWQTVVYEGRVVGNTILAENSCVHSSLLLVRHISLLGTSCLQIYNTMINDWN
ncbi:hypothetical protein F5887DRAFT_890629, partial [Amanita rubescens]